jgi:hypothetical protein
LVVSLVILDTTSALVNYRWNDRDGHHEGDRRTGRPEDPKPLVPESQFKSPLPTTGSKGFRFNHQVVMGSNEFANYMWKDMMKVTKSGLLTATLVIPCLAQGADPSANLSVQVVPPGSGPTVPSQAAAAGFTTLALNSDFTQQLPSNWLGGCAVAGNGQPVGDFFSDDTGHTWWLNLWWAYNYQPCLTVQRQDPTFGGLVLDMPWTVDNGHTAQGTVIETASWDYNHSQGRGTAVSFPSNSYYEVVARITPAAPGAYMVLNTWAPDGISKSSPNTIEWDIIETDGNVLKNYSAAVHNWGNGGAGTFLWLGQDSPGLPSDYDPAQYHTFGLRVTSDGTLMSGCSYIDNKFITCKSLPGGLSVTQAANGRNFLVLQNACDWWNYGGQCTSGQQQHLYVKSVRVWSCTNWKTTQCSGTALTGAP